MQDVEPLPSKRPNLASDPSSSSHFSRTNSSGSYSEASAVPPELRSQLESIGMRTRFSACFNFLLRELFGFSLLRELSIYNVYRCQSRLC